MTRIEHQDHEGESQVEEHTEEVEPGARDDRGSHADHGSHGTVYRNRFWVVVLLAIPVLILSGTIQDWFGYTIGSFFGDDVVPPLLGSAIFVYGGWPFLSGALPEARRRAPGMMMLISLAITVAYVASIVSEFTSFDQEFWWELATLIAVMLFGHWQEMRALGQARGALEALAALLPDTAERITTGGTETVAVTQLARGDILLVRPGGRVPADGTIVDGTADLDESVVTGETRPVTKTTNDRVVAGTVVAGSALRIRVDAIGDETTLAGIRRMIAAAQESKSRTQVLADRAAALLFYVAVVSGIVTVAVWAALGEGDEGTIRAVGVLVIACPHALGLAIPLVVALSTSISARAGILVKDRLALERMRLVDTVLFDKTGTLTKGEHTVTGVAATDGDTERVLRLAAAVEADSEHPLAYALVRAGRAGGDLPPAREFEALPGLGVKARVNGTVTTVGGPALLREYALAVPDQLAAPESEWRRRGAAVLYIATDGTVVGAVALEDVIRPESRDAIDLLHAQGIRVALITGDAQQVAESVARELSIDEVFAEVLPGDKDQMVAELQARGDTVAMVGDGVNDAPALARADVGIAIGAGTDVAIASAGMVLSSDDPRGVVSIHRLSKAGYRKMTQNLAWAAGYNLIAIPLAAGVLSPVGFVLPVAVGALLMSLSTVIVALNAQLLRRVDLQQVDATESVA